MFPDGSQHPMLIALFLGASFSLVLTPLWIELMRRFSWSQPIRSTEVMELAGLHQHKHSTPTMGGVPILCSVLCARAFSPLPWGRLDLLLLLPFVSIGLLGAWDDLHKLMRGNWRGVSGRLRMLAEVAVAVAWLALAFQWQQSWLPSTSAPFLQQLALPFGEVWALSLFACAPLAAFVFAGSVNAVNLTDGLDGLAGGLLTLSFCTLAVLSGQLWSSHPSGEAVTLWAMTAVGALLGFLVFNRHPAKIFMGDCGSSACGALMAAMTILLRLELLLALFGLVYVVETLSVILQVGAFKLSGRRLLRCAPLHHHFEMAGVHEVRIVRWLWGLGVLTMLLTLFLMQSPSSSTISP